jgi:hypothetical protein
MVEMMPGKRTALFLVWVLVLSVLWGILPLNSKVEATPENWVEKIIKDTPSAVTSVVIGDADNDCNEEVVIGMWSPTNEVRLYKRSGGSWDEDLIVKAPVSVYSVAIGDADNDGSNEVVVGMVSTTNEVRAYKNIAGIWIEDIINDTSTNVNSVAIGDADNDGSNEVVIGLHSSSDEVRCYEKSGGTWIEDVIVDSPTNVRSVAIGDADNDGNNEVVIGMDSTTNELRAYEYESGNWIEDVVADTPNNVYSIAIGDADSDGYNDIVIGLHSSTHEVRCYNKSGGNWLEDNIADTPNHVWSVAIGDADDDGVNEVVIGMMSTTYEVRAYEKVANDWTEDIIVDTPNDVFSVAIGDADNDARNEVVIGMWSADNEVRIFDYDPGEIIFTSHENEDYVSGITCFEVAVTSGSMKEVRFYLNAELEHIDKSHPYQYIIDTTKLVEGAIYEIKAEAIGNNCSSISATINITVNNFEQTGNYISVNSMKNSYEPDQEVSVLIGTISPPVFDSLNLVMSYSDPSGNTVYAVKNSLPPTPNYIFGLPLYSDAKLGVYTITVVAYGFNNGALIWNATNGTAFEVFGTNVHERQHESVIG